MLVHRVALRDFERRPEAIVGAGDGGVGGADDDVAGEGSFSNIQSNAAEIFLPGPARRPALPGEVGGHQRLADAADGAGAEHGGEALEDGGLVDAAEAGDFVNRIGLKAWDLVLGDGENAGVDRIGGLDCEG